MMQLAQQGELEANMAKYLPQELSPHGCHAPQGYGYPQEMGDMQGQPMQYAMVPQYMVPPFAGQFMPMTMPMPMPFPRGYPQGPPQEQAPKRAKRRSRKKVEPLVPERGSKVFVGGLSPASNSETLRNYFDSYGDILDCSVLLDSTTKRSRGFGFVEFAGGIPPGVIGKDHIIGERRCGVRAYHYDPMA